MLGREKRKNKMPAICLTIMILGMIVVVVGLLIAYFDAIELPVYAWIVGSIVTSLGLLGLMGYYIHKWVANYV